MSTYLFAGLIGFSVFLALGYGPRLNPGNFDWLNAGDPAQISLGWMFYRHSPWQWPITHISLLLPPDGTNLIFTDSLPWGSVLFKIFSPLLPEPFQFFGLWIALCFILQGVFSFRLLTLLRLENPFALLGTAFYCMSSVLILRSSHHLSLCAHWLFLWIFTLAVRVVRGRDFPWIQIALIQVLASGFHPYLAFMTAILAAGLAGTYFFKQRALQHPLSRGFFFQALMVPLALFLSLWILGYLQGGSSPRGPGFGLFSAGFLTFFGSGGHSAFFPNIRSGPSQYEGEAYLGLGGLLLFACALSKARELKRARFWKPYWPLIASIGLLMFYAFSSHLSFAGHTFLKLEWLYNLIEPIPSIFRSSGRMIWPAYYALLTLILWNVATQFSRQRALFLMTVALIIQAIEFAPQFFPWKLSTDIAGWNPLQSEYWKKPSPFKKLSFIPPYLNGATCGCFKNIAAHDEIVALAYWAAGKKLEMNSAFSARAVSPLNPECAELCDPSHPGNPGVLYAVLPQTPSHYREIYKKRHRCRSIDGVTLCTSIP